MRKMTMLPEAVNLEAGYHQRVIIIVLGSLQEVSLWSTLLGVVYIKYKESLRKKETDVGGAVERVMF